MREMIRLLVVIAVFSAVSGGLLAAIQSGTKDRIEYQQLKFVKGPTIQQILEGSSNDPLVDRFKLPDGKEERSFFVGVFDGKANVVALEAFGKGFGGDIGVMIAVNVENDEIVGIGVTTHSETPGVGSKVKTDPSLSEQFKGLPIKEPFKVKAEGGQIDAISGATVSSRGVCGAVVDSAEIYMRLKKDIIEKLKAFKT
ncbi:MAG: RnfABCDGE type electron transport complex subunit G [Gammaproteobacteria bacterium]|jgi:electron transport complex protein RnfG|nr:RnfABCDGE type electron transport complex subunit G [Gammaproteobacteria bacterium]